eukprot:gene8552-9465_t
MKKISWPTLVRERVLPDDLCSVGKMLVRGTYKQIPNAVWKNPSLGKNIIPLVAPSAAPVIDYERAFIRSLEHRIPSFEKQLDDKQSIIKKLLGERTSSKFKALGLGLQDNPLTIVKNNCAHSIESNETKPSETRNKGINHLPEQERSAANVSGTSSNTVKQNKLKNRSSDKKKQESSMENGNNEQETAQPEKNTRKRVFIIGDSMLNGISEYGLNKVTT